jgi:hypothetical protein
MGATAGLSPTSRKTTGAHFQLGKADDLALTFDRVIDELRSQYVLGFSRERFDGQTHKLDLQMRQKGLSARSRKSYLAASR